MMGPDGTSLKFYKKATIAPCPPYFFKNFCLIYLYLSKYGVRVSEIIFLQSAAFDLYYKKMGVKFKKMDKV